MNRKGFTLTELMVVVLIIAVMTAIAIPFYTNSIDEQSNQRAKSVLQAVNSGMERFFREYPYVRVPEYDPNTNSVVFITNPSANARCTYKGQQIGLEEDGNISLTDFVEQIILCGYIPNLNYGQTQYYEAGALEYKIALQNPNSSRCRYTTGYAYMEAKADENNVVKIDSRYCKERNHVCSYCAGIKDGQVIDSDKTLVN